MATLTLALLFFGLQLMVGPAKTLFMDEISTGLDSSTTYLIVRCIRNYVHLLEVRCRIVVPASVLARCRCCVAALFAGSVVWCGQAESCGKHHRASQHMCSACAWLSLCKPGDGNRC